MAVLILTAGILQQSTFSKVGKDLDYDTVYFTKGEYIVNKPIMLNPGTTLTGDRRIKNSRGIVIDRGAVITLVANASKSIFSEGTPIFGQITKTIRDIIVENIGFNGNADNQLVSHGDGYHNFIGLNYGTNITIRNVWIESTQGDGARLTDCSKIQYYGNEVYGCGHDGFYGERCSEIDAYNNTTYLRSNSALRCKDSSHVAFHNNFIYRTDEFEPAYSPGIQIQISGKGKTSTDIEVFENYVSGTLGPAVWAVGFTNVSSSAGSDLNIHHNIFVDCGHMPAANKISGVGGIACDGWTNVIIKDNTFDKCMGNGILFGSYIGSSAGKGYTAEVSNNIIVGTVKSLYPGAQSGAGIANLIPEKYTVTCKDNNLYGNVHDYVNVKGTGIAVDPLFVGPHDYHLQSIDGHFTNTGLISDTVTSPCLSEKGEYGRYNGTTEASKYTIRITTSDNPSDLIGTDQAVIIVCSSENGALGISKAITEADLLNGEKMVVYVPSVEK